jgi:hypothetical protein
MTHFLTLTLVVLGFMGVLYLGLALALRARERRHGRCNCSAAPGDNRACCMNPRE